MSPWERRERGGLYYTRSKKVNGEVVREYVGGGVLGELAARMDSLERRQREEEAAAWKEEREQMEALDADLLIESAKHGCHDAERNPKASAAPRSSQ